MARIGGSAFHVWSERYDLVSIGESQTEPADPAEIFTELVEKEEFESRVLRDQWVISGRKTQEKPNKEDFDCWRDQLLPDFCERYIAWRNQSQWRIATSLPEGADGSAHGIEREIDFYIAGTRLKAYVDRVMVDENGDYIAVDIKTWSRERASVQLPTYAVGLRKKQIPVTWGAYYEARKGKNTEPKLLTKWDEQRLSALYAQAQAMEAAGFYLPNPGDACKNFCSVSAGCDYSV